LPSIERRGPTGRPEPACGTDGVRPVTRGYGGRSPSALIRRWKADAVTYPWISEDAGAIAIAPARAASFDRLLRLLDDLAHLLAGDQAHLPQRLQGLDDAIGGGLVGVHDAVAVQIGVGGNRTGELRRSGG